ncbi:hypothetical protein LX36DRAFT_675852 [Colletotrichum falcatum]|nr:hypothetical protein LX36DRAFT_675852 [Colletotrichum falcatum]
MAFAGFEGCGPAPAPPCSSGGGSVVRSLRIAYYHKNWATTKPCDPVEPEYLGLTGLTHLNFALTFFDPIIPQLSHMDANAGSLSSRFTALKAKKPGLVTQSQRRPGGGQAKVRRQAVASTCYWSPCGGSCTTGYFDVAEARGSASGVQCGAVCGAGEVQRLCCASCTTMGFYKWEGFRGVACPCSPACSDPDATLVSDLTCMGGYQAYCCNWFALFSITNSGNLVIYGQSNFGAGTNVIGRRNGGEHGLVLQKRGKGGKEGTEAFCAAPAVFGSLETLGLLSIVGGFIADLLGSIVGWILGDNPSKPNNTRSPTTIGTRSAYEQWPLLNFGSNAHSGQTTTSCHCVVTYTCRYGMGWDKICDSQRWATNKVAGILWRFDPLGGKRFLDAFGFRSQTPGSFAFFAGSAATRTYTMIVDHGLRVLENDPPIRHPRPYNLQPVKLQKRATQEVMAAGNAREDTGNSTEADGGSRSSSSSNSQPGAVRHIYLDQLEQDGLRGEDDADIDARLIYDQLVFLDMAGDPVDGRTCDVIYEDRDPQSRVRIAVDEDGNVNKSPVTAVTPVVTLTATTTSGEARTGSGEPSRSPCCRKKGYVHLSPSHLTNRWVMAVYITIRSSNQAVHTNVTRHVWSGT